MVAHFVFFAQPSHALFKMLSDELGRISLVFKLKAGSLSW